MSSKSSRKLIIAIIVFFAIVIAVPITLVFPKNFRHLFWSPVCIEKAVMEKAQLNSVVISKFRDYNNHNYNTIKFQDIITHSISNIHFINEESGFYNFIQEGDTIFKLPGNLEISIINKKTKSILIYNCEE